MCECDSRIASFRGKSVPLQLACGRRLAESIWLMVLVLVVVLKCFWRSGEVKIHIYNSALTVPTATSMTAVTLCFCPCWTRYNINMYVRMYICIYSFIVLQIYMYVWISLDPLLYRWVWMKMYSCIIFFCGCCCCCCSENRVDDSCCSNTIWLCLINFTLLKSAAGKANQNVWKIECICHTYSHS